MKKLTQKQLIKDFQEVHGDRYDYSKFIYVKSLEPSIIICEKHGEFRQSHNNHYGKGKGCGKCAGRGLSDNERIEEYNEIHNHKYVYELFKFKSSKLKVIIVCKKHGNFTITPNNHRLGKGCGKCIGRGLTNKERIAEYNIIHDYKYDYGKYIYNGTRNNSIITCKIHGDFEQTPSKHRSGSGCGKCAGRGLTDKERIAEYNIIHDYKYDYDKYTYNGNNNNFIITCKIHGDFEQTHDTHKGGSGCGKCVGRGLTDKERITEYNITHDCKYDYDKYIYNGPKENSIITCKIHGDFEQTPSNHRSGKGCNECKSSRGEIRILKYLKRNNIKYEAQTSFDGCFDLAKLRFDFYLHKYNICIEYDGVFHYKVFEFRGGNKALQDRKKKDKIKNKYCKDNNIRLIRIPYWDFENIETILEKELIK